MPSTQEILELLNNMQSQAQQNLPVIPNNGNPNGAYNVSPNSDKGGINPRIPNSPMYPWLEPSPSMANLASMLSQPLMGGSTAPPAQNNVGIQPVPNQPVVPKAPSMQPPAPTLPPQPVSQLPPLPGQRTGMTNQAPLPRYGMKPVQRY